MPTSRCRLTMHIYNPGNVSYILTSISYLPAGCSFILKSTFTIILSVFGAKVAHSYHYRQLVMIRPPYHHHNRFTALLPGPSGWAGARRELLGFMVQGKINILTIWLGATPSRLTSAHLHHPPTFLQAGCPSCHPTNSAKALKATSAFGLGRRR